jgi:hypothetical protein
MTRLTPPLIFVVVLRGGASLKGAPQRTETR